MTNEWCGATMKRFFSDYSIAISALSSCAIEGNEFAAGLLKLRDGDPDKFYAELLRLGYVTLPPPPQK